jgi:hypothetical protein
MGEDEHGIVVGRVVAPPARPLLVIRLPPALDRDGRRGSGERDLRLDATSAVLPALLLVVVLGLLWAVAVRGFAPAGTWVLDRSEAQAAGGE